MHPKQSSMKGHSFGKSRATRPPCWTSSPRSRLPTRAIRAPRSAYLRVKFPWITAGRSGNAAIGTWARSPKLPVVLSIVCAPGPRLLPRVDDDLAEHLTVLQQALPLGGLGQREHAIDHRPDPSVPGGLHQGQEIRPGPPVRAEDGQLPPPDVADVGLGIVSRRGPAGEQAAALPKAPQAAHPGVGPGVVDHHVHPALACQAPDLAIELHLAVIDQVIGAERPEARQFVL